MGNSRRFLALKKRMAQLEHDLLPPVNAVGGYTLQDQDQIRGFRILVHAEIEAFLEDLASDIVKRSLNRYTATGKANKILKSLAQAFCRSHRPTTGEDFFVSAVKQYQDVIKGNHGIKEANICVLFLPIGIDRGLLDSAWLIGQTVLPIGQAFQTITAGFEEIVPAIEEVVAAIPEVLWTAKSVLAAVQKVVWTVVKVPTAFVRLRRDK
jgi:hypothetical protein